MSLCYVNLTKSVPFLLKFVICLLLKISISMASFSCLFRRFPNYYYSLTYNIPGGGVVQILMIDTVLLCGNTGADYLHDQPHGPQDLGAADDQLAWITQNMKSSRYLVVFLIHIYLWYMRNAFKWTYYMYVFDVCKLPLRTLRIKEIAYFLECLTILMKILVLITTQIMEKQKYTHTSNKMRDHGIQMLCFPTNMNL